MKAEEFIKSEQNGVLLNDYTLQDMIWFMTEFAKKKVSEQLTIPYVSESSWAYYEQELNKITQLKQTQSSLSKQMEILRPFANKLGLYDVSDYLRNSR
jgi:hypothetical protein